MKVKTTKSFQQKLERIKVLKNYIHDMQMTMLQREANVFIKIFQDGIKNRAFRTQKLKDSTIKQKTRKGYSQPTTPLYGAGLDEEKSYINMLLVRKLKKGVKIYPSWAKHHESKLELRELLIIHEQGRTIQRKEGKPIVIPPRPIFKKTHDLFKSKILKLRKSEYKEIRKAMSKWIKRKDFTGIVKATRAIPGKIK